MIDKIEEKDRFDELSSEDPDREDEVNEEELDGIPASSYQSDSMTAKDSDLQSTLKTLFPSFEDSELSSIAQIVMLGRGFPETFESNVYLITTTLARSHRHDPKFNVILTRQIIEGLFQIGLEGKGRVEAVIVSGNTKEIAEQGQGMGRL